MGKKSKLVALVAGASLLLGTFGLTACAPENDDKTGNRVPEDIYAIYTAYAETAGEDAMTYDEWYAHLLETAKGDKGDDGKSAYDIWKENGHSGTEAEFLEWLKGGKGDDGKSAYDIWKEQDGNAEKTEAEFVEWLKGDKGDDGDVGPKGEAGTKWFTGEDDEPSANLGAEGDFYLNTKTFDLWSKNKDSGWIKLGCIKGADGKDGGGSSPVNPTGNQVDIAADNEQTISVTLSEGMHIIEADLGATALTTGRLQAKVGDVISELVLSEARSTAAGGNKIYYGYVNIKADTSEITIMAKSEAVKATIAFKDWTVPTIKEDEPIEMPIYPNGTSKDNITPIQFDESFLDGKYKVKLNAAEISSGVDVYLDSVINIFFAPGKYMVDTNILAKKGHKTFYLMEMSAKQGDHVINPAIVTFTAN